MHYLNLEGRSGKILRLLETFWLNQHFCIWKYAWWIWGRHLLDYFCCVEPEVYYYVWTSWDLFQGNFSCITTLKTMVQLGLRGLYLEFPFYLFVLKQTSALWYLMSSGFVGDILHRILTSIWLTFLHWLFNIKPFEF